jgi:hypothetical protein
VLKFYIFCPHSKYLIFVWIGEGGGGSTLNVFKMMYFSPLFIFKFESNLLKMIVIWFIKGYHIFKIPIKYDLFLIKY